MKIDPKRLTNDELINNQKAIKKILSINIPKLKQLRQQVSIFEFSTCKLQASYAELSQELHIRTKGITICNTYKTKKKSTINKTNKLIKQLVKDLGSEEVRRLLAKL